VIYVDDAAIPYKGKLRYHMTATSLEELHFFARSIGVKRCWFHRARTHPHYDITEDQRTAALDGGASLVSSKMIASIAQTISRN